MPRESQCQVFIPSCLVYAKQVQSQSYKKMLTDSKIWQFKPTATNWAKKIDIVNLQ